MNVAWLTPFSRGSAIAEFSQHVTETLAEWCEVDIWVSDDEEPRRETPLRTYQLTPERLGRLAHYDVVVHNIGDHLAYHGAIVEASRVQPGIVVLHDRSCHNLFAGYWLERGERETYVSRLEVLYGAEAGAAATAALRGVRPHIWDSDDDVLLYPLSDEALVGALGAVAHSTDHANQLRGRWFGPVGELFLPAYGRPAAAPRPAASEPVTLLTLGYVNRNKQVHRMLEVLGRNPDLAARVRYLVVGPGLRDDYAAELKELERRYSLDCVSFLGHRPDDEVERLLADADVFVNLRYPPLEGASASLMRQLELGRPVLALDVGGFAELPEGALVRVPPENDEALAQALRRLIDDPAHRAEVGAAGRKAAEGRSLERYAKEFLSFADEVRSWEPIVRTIDQAAAELARIGVDERSRRELQSVAKELAAVVEGIAPEPHFRLLGREDLMALRIFFRENDTPAVDQALPSVPARRRGGRGDRAAHG